MEQIIKNNILSFIINYYTGGKNEKEINGGVCNNTKYRFCFWTYRMW